MSAVHHRHVLMVGYVTPVLGVTAVLVLVLGTPGHIAPMVSTSSPCSNGGVCNNSPGSYSCTCTGTGYTGTHCTNGKYIIAMF